MAIHQLNPLSDARWGEFIAWHPHASIFHTPGWLDALHRTYGYQPLALTSNAPREALKNAVVFCRVESRLTGSRLVSLPFADHCEPLVENSAELESILSFPLTEFGKAGWKYIELRPLHAVRDGLAGFRNDRKFYSHTLDLQPGLDKLYNSFHKDSVGRKITRAGKEGLVIEEGDSQSLLDHFYRLLVLARRRHKLPPQPKQWFRNLIRTLPGGVRIHIAHYRKQPIAAILTLRFKHVQVYKYGCSDARYHSLGGMHALFWRAIQDAKRDGLQLFDFGRSDSGNTGLLAFKNRWGTSQSTITYLRYPPSDETETHHSLARRVAGELFARMPDRVLTTMGNLLYRHMG